MTGDLSIEQAALRRAELSDLPAPWGSVLAAMEAGERLADTRYRDLLARCESQAAQLAEQGDALLALSNRIETLTRTVTLHHGQLAQVLGHSPLDGVS